MSRFKGLDPLGMGVKWPVRTRTRSAKKAQRSAGDSLSCLNHEQGSEGEDRLSHTVAIVLKEKRPIAGVEGRSGSLRLDGELVLGAHFRDRHLFCDNNVLKTASAQSQLG